VNNRPEVAFESASGALGRTGQGTEVRISVAPRKTLGEVLAI
jgi:hypothetical protein